MPQDNKKKPSKPKSAQKEKGPARSKGSLLALESRLMFDAAATATASEVQSEQVAQEQAEAAVSGDSSGGETQASTDSQDLLQAISTFMPNESRTEVVFVDPTVPNYQKLLIGMDPSIEVIMLDGEQDGIEQMASALAGRTGIDAIHVISHGSAGELHLGTATLNLTIMSGQYADQLATIKQALSEQADFLVYGCDFADGATGQAAVDQLAVLTGADVAASVDLTGAAALGGDWVLEERTGSIETQLAINYDTQVNWVGLLDTAIWASSGDTSPNVADWDGSAFGATGNTATIGQLVVIDGAEAPTRDEKIIVGVTTGGAITGEMYSGGTWSALPFTMIASGAPSDGHGFDIAYESTSGDALLVWNNLTTGTNNVSYRIWNGSTWSAVQTVTAPLSGRATQIKLAADPNSDKIIMHVTNAASDDYAIVWNGSSWGNSITLGTATSLESTDAAIAVEFQSGAGLAVYDDTVGGTTLNYRTWDGVTWSAAGSIAAPAGVAGDPRFVTMASDPSSDTVALTVVTGSNEVWFAVWNGSAWGSQVLASTTASSSTTQVSAVAFESQSGTLIATYGESGTNTVQYRTWTSGIGWSAELVGPNIGAVPNSMTLSAESTSDRLILAVQNANNDLNYVQWNGSAWETTNTLALNTGQTTAQPFLFLYDVNAAPTITNLTGDSLAYSEGDGAVVIEQGANALVADVDSTNFDTGTLTVSFAAGSDSAEDLLSIRNQGTGAGQIGVSGSNVTYAGVTIGTFTGGSAGVNLVITFNSNATPTAVTALVKNITFQDTDTNAPTTGARTVRFVLTDGDSGTSANYDTTVTVTAVNDAPVLADTALSLTVAEDAGAPSGAVGSLVSAFTGGITDVDSGAVKGLAITGSNETTGTWYYTTNGGTTWTAVGTVSSASTLLLADNGSTRLYFAPNADYNGTSTAALTVRAWDQTSGSAGTKVSTASTGGTTAFSSATDTVDVTVTAVNDAPVLADTALTLTVAEDAGTPSGAVGSLLSAFTGGISDVDASAVKGIAITGTNETNGTWYYTTNGGTTWTAVGSVSNTSALLLADNGSTRLYFAPNTDYNGPSTGALTLRAWDQTSGSAGTKVSTASNGGTTAFSSATDTIDVTVSAVNDAPTDLSLSANTVAENAANGTVVGTITGTDLDAGDTKTYSFTDSAGGRFAIDSSTGQITVANSSLLNYESATSHSVTVRVTDNGGLTYDETFTINVTNVNETPTDLSLSANTVAENAVNGTTIGTVSGRIRTRGTPRPIASPIVRGGGLRSTAVPA